MTTVCAFRVRVRGVVQGVGFRPFVYGLAERHALAGSVVNSPAGVDIALEGPPAAIEAFLSDMQNSPPVAAIVSDITVEAAEVCGLVGFHIGESDRNGKPSAQMSADLPVCDDCLRELFDPNDRRYLYPYINCTNCGPRFSLTIGLPYDRRTTTMASWPMCADCDREFNDPFDRRFHAQPVACPTCGPGYRLERSGAVLARNADAIAQAARLLASGAILAIKGIGGYHLACDARNANAVEELRQRKYRKARAFALMVRDIDAASALAYLNAQEQAVLISRGRPIVLVPARMELAGIAPAHPNLGIMLPYTPLHFLLFAAGAPNTLVMTSGNRSSEPIAFDDDDARCRLSGIADAFLVGERPIARRVDDSVVQTVPSGPMIVRRSRGYAPAVVARLQTDHPILAVGGDLKNTVALAVAGGVMVSQHIGDLEHHGTRTAFEQTIRGFLELYDVDLSRLSIAHDRHPDYASTQFALALSAHRHLSVQHHRAHIASVLAEQEALTTRVLGVAFDGTGFGDDGAIWGGEFFLGSVAERFERIGHLRPARLPGGDAAAAFPVQAAAGFVAQIDTKTDLADALELPVRYRHAGELVAKGVRTFTTTSVGRLFDAVAAVLGFTEQVTFEAQAAVWLERQAMGARSSAASIPFDYSAGELDWRPAVRAVIEARLAGKDIGSIALGFHLGLAHGVAQAVATLCRDFQVRIVVVTGGVFQNQLLLSTLNDLLGAEELTVWMNHAVPPGDGGLSLGQAAIASLRA